MWWCLPPRCRPATGRMWSCGDVNREATGAVDSDTLWSGGGWRCLDGQDHIPGLRPCPESYSCTQTHWSSQAPSPKSWERCAPSIAVPEFTRLPHQRSSCPQPPCRAGNASVQHLGLWQDQGPHSPDLQGMPSLPHGSFACLNHLHRPTVLGHLRVLDGCRHSHRTSRCTHARLLSAHTTHIAPSAPAGPDGTRRAQRSALVDSRARVMEHPGPLQQA